MSAIRTTHLGLMTIVSQRTCSFPIAHASSLAQSLLWSAMRVGQRPAQSYPELAVFAHRSQMPRLSSPTFSIPQFASMSAPLHSCGGIPVYLLNSIALRTISVRSSPLATWIPKRGTIVLKLLFRCRCNQKRDRSQKPGFFHHLKISRLIRTT